MKNFLLVLILLLFVNTGYCAEIKRYVCTASTAGGDGTTSATTGANRAYASLEECMNANEQDLTDNGGDTFVVEITGDCSTADTTAVTIHNYTTSADCYINIYTTATARHKGIYSTSYYRLEVGVWKNYILGVLNVPNVFLTGLQIKNTTTDTDIAHNALYGSTNAGSDMNWRFDKIITQSTGHSLIISNDNNKDIIIKNSIFKSLNANAFYTPGTWNYALGIQCLNCNFISLSNTNAVYIQYYTITFKNCYAYSNGANDDWGSNVSLTTCASSDGSQSTSTVAYSTDNFTNVTAGSEDLHLVVGSDLIDVGTDLSSTFTDDIDGDTRSGTWDIGADEYVNPIQTNLILNNVILNNVQLN